MAGDPQRKVKTVKTIAIFDMFLAVFATIFHTWLIIWSWNFSDAAEKHKGQIHGAVYFGFIMIIIHLVLFGLTWRLLSGVKQFAIDPILIIKAGRRWKNWSICALVLFIVLVLLPLCLTSKKRVNEGPTQLYLVYILLLVTFQSYAIWYVGKFVEDTLSFNAGSDSRIYFVPSPPIDLKA